MGYAVSAIGGSMKKVVVCAAALAGVAFSAHAADLGDAASMKDPLPDALTYHGVTIYGTVDVGYAYQTNGKPTGAVISTMEFNPVTTSRNFTGQSISTIAGNGLEQSKIGVKIEEQIGYGFTAIGKLDTGFDPITGSITDGCSSFVQNAGKSAANQNSNADTSRCGQAFNGVSYAGVSSPLYGTLTVGRQQSLQLDSIATYDPLSLSYAFSLIGYSGTNGGSGSTEAARWDNSVKYLYQFGPVHAAAMYSNGGDGTGLFGDAYGFNLGATYKGFSIDGVYTKEHGAVNLKDVINDAVGQPLAASISDNENFSVMGKYTYEFGGGFKDEGPSSKLTFFSGYSHVDVSDPHSKVLAGDAEGGYAIGNGAGGSIDNIAFQSTKVLQYFWTGAKYELPSGWSFTGAYYYEDQSAYQGDNKYCTSGALSSLCAGTLNQGSFVVDYAFNKHFDVYAGVSYAIVDGGLAASFPTSTTANATVDTTVFMSGLRLKF